MELRLYAWQKECLSLWSDNGCRGIVNVVTGAGKTMLALAAVERLSALPGMGSLRVRIVVPKTFLVRQWERALREYLSVSREDIGIYTGSRKSGPNRMFMIYVINSARYSLARHIVGDVSSSRPVFLIADECHHYGTDENARIFDFYKRIDKNARVYTLGLSATPNCEHFEDVLVPSLGREIFQFSFNHALRAGIINRFAVFHIGLMFSGFERVDYDDLTDQISLALTRLRRICPNLGARDSSSFFSGLKHLAETSKDPETADLANAVVMLSYQRKEIVYQAGARVCCVLDLVRLIRRDAKIIIFGERIEKADEIYYRLSNIYPNEAGLYHSGLNKSAGESALKRFEDGEIRILVSCKTLDEGLSVNNADVGIIVSSTGSKRQRIQRLGRILRKKDTERLAYFYYLYIENTVEETDLLREHLSGLERFVSMIDLYYNDRTGEFSDSYYSVLAASVISRYRDSGWSGEAVAELDRNFKKGIVTCDWLIDEEQCLERIRGAKDRVSRNYYTAMLYLIREMKK